MEETERAQGLSSKLLVNYRKKGDDSWESLTVSQKKIEEMEEKQIMRRTHNNFAIRCEVQACARVCM